MRERYPVVEATIHSETDKAVLLTFEYGSVQYPELWVPKSVIHDDSLDDIDEAFRDDKIEVAIAGWWLDQQ